MRGVDYISIDCFQYSCTSNGNSSSVVQIVVTLYLIRIDIFLLCKYFSKEDADTLSDSSAGRQMDSASDTEEPPLPPLQLPPSSGTIGVPEQCVSHLFSVYGFLRSFSIRLFLSPFSLDEFVGSLNCQVSDTLFDAIHVSLMRALKHHLETLSSEGSELASKCLRCLYLFLPSS